MKEIKLYKSKHKFEIEQYSEYGYGNEIKKQHLYLIIYLGNVNYDKNYCASALLVYGNDDDKAIRVLKKSKIDGTGINYLLTPKGYLKGDLKETFLIDFDTSKGVNLSVLKHDGYEYRGMDSIGLIGKFINESSFNAAFYNCFGDKLFDEDKFILIYESFPNGLT